MQKTLFRPWAVIPAKDFGRGKSRLSRALEPTQRRELAREMFERVLDACTGCGELHGTLVATDGKDAALLADRRGAAVLCDQGASASSLSGIVDTALSSLDARGATHALVVMADLPLLCARDLRELLAQLHTHDFAIAPDAQRRGTSALGLRLGLGARSCFGHGDSLQRHLREATRVKASTCVLYNPRIAFDVDSPADLARFAGVSCIMRQNIQR